jgi:hypothetical protein
MSTPERSAAVARALAAEPNGLPGDFAVQVAALAQAERVSAWSWNDFALVAAFLAMLWVCVLGMGWLGFGTPVTGGSDWVAPVVDVAASHSWLLAGVVGVLVVQMLTLRRRAAI